MKQQHPVIRRRQAFDQLRSLTVGTAVAGVAATAGFGALAAVTFHGTTDAAPVSITDPGGGTNGVTGDDGNQLPAATPRPRTGSSGNTSQNGVTPFTGQAPRHATTGGSR